MKRTKPTQAASKSWLDKAQNDVKAMCADIDWIEGWVEGPRARGYEIMIRRIRRRLMRLLASMQKAERR